MLEDFVDSARTQVLFVYFCVILPLSVSLAPNRLDATVQEFKVYRLQQFDLQGNLHGSRAWRVSLEAGSLDSGSLVRRCLVVWWRDLIGRAVRDIVQQSVGAILIILPSDLDAVGEEDSKELMELEQELVLGSAPIPIYFALATPELLAMEKSLGAAQTSEYGSAFSALLNAVTANSYQLVNSIQVNSAKVEEPLYNIVGKLSAYERGTETPTVVIVAHYDAMGAAPALSFGADSNGSGVSALLELARLFHSLYQSPKTRAKYNLVFLLSTGGKLNYQGSRQWIEEQLEQSDGVLHRMDFVVCLDSLGAGSELRMHVSKLPKEGSAPMRFFRSLERAARVFNGSVQLVQKKINLAEEFLAWEHERFSIRRLPAFTISHYDSAKHLPRNTILDRMKKVDIGALRRNVLLIAEALLHELYELPEEEVATESLFGREGGAREEMLRWGVESVGGRARAAQLLASGGAKDPVVADLLHALDHHTHQADLHPVLPDKKDPEFVVYGVASDTMSAHRVKPAVFDLLLAVCIVAYLGLLYLAVLNFHEIRALIQRSCGRMIKLKLL